MDRSDLYLRFKICLLMEGKSIKDFADEQTGTSPQHVTMVAKGEKDSAPVIEQIFSFIDATLQRQGNQRFLLKMIEHGQAVNEGRATRHPEAEEDGDYDW